MKRRAPREPGHALNADPLGQAWTRLVDGWVRAALGDVVVEAGLPSGDDASDVGRIGLTLIDVIPATPARASHQPAPLRLLARYLVTAQGPDADRRIVTLAFHALETGQPELERESPPAALWSALGARARPALVARALLEQPREVPPVPLVRQIVTRWSERRPIGGRVLGPGDLPIAGARIEVEAAGLATVSDHRGEFRLIVPAGPPAPTLSITAKGARLTVRADGPPGEPLVIRVPLPEL